ncbi:hypothetical protein OAH62_01490 [Candidatus Marinimicrobia bacterium]|nr:hypothetical protein [Candidatus Neomarinimicrobiota bacterium]
MKKTFIIISILLLTYSCEDVNKSQNISSQKKDTVKEQPKPEKVIFEDIIYTSDNNRDKMKVGYFVNTKWDDSDWVSRLEYELQSHYLNTVIIFSSKKNTPNVSTKGMNYRTKYDKYMEAGYWRFPTGKRQFCYGGVDKKLDWHNCK